MASPIYFEHNVKPAGYAVGWCPGNGFVPTAVLLDGALPDEPSHLRSAYYQTPTLDWSTDARQAQRHPSVETASAYRDRLGLHGPSHPIVALYVPTVALTGGSADARYLPGVLPVVEHGPGGRSDVA